MNPFDFKFLLRGFADATDEGRLHAVLDEAVHALGFEQFAMGHHVDLTGPPRDAIRLTSYHADWIDESVERRYFVDDPVHKASVRCATGFLWSDIPTLIDVSGRQQCILERARRFGLVEGYTVPVPVPGEYRGTCSFGARSTLRLRPDALPLCQLIDTYARAASCARGCAGVSACVRCRD